MVTDMEKINLDDKDSVITQLIYPDESKKKEFLREPPSADPTPETGPPRKNLLRKRPRNPIMMPYQNIILQRGRVPLYTNPKRNSEIPERLTSTQIHHSKGAQ